MNRRKQEKEDILKAKQCIMPLLRSATQKDYTDWLKIVFSYDEKQTLRYRNIPWSLINDQWYVAINHLLTPVELYGANSINIIVPAHFYVVYDPKIHMQWGHIQLCFAKTGTTSDGIVEFFSDMLNTATEIELKKSWFKRGK